MQACIGRFADPTIALTTEEINLGIVKKAQNNDHSEIETTLFYDYSLIPSQ